VVWTSSGLDIGNPISSTRRSDRGALSVGATSRTPTAIRVTTACRLSGTAVAAYYHERRFGVSLDPETEVLPLIGSKEGIVNLALACLDPGDLVLVPDPGYAPLLHRRLRWLARRRTPFRFCPR